MEIDYNDERLTQVGSDQLYLRMLNNKLCFKMFS